MDFQPILSPTIFPRIPEDLIIDDIIWLASSSAAIIDWLMHYGLLARGMKCKCGEVMNMGNITVTHWTKSRGDVQAAKRFAQSVTDPSLLLQSFHFHLSSNFSITGAKIYKLMLSWKNT